MANQVVITSALNITPPFSGVACDVYGNQCQYLSSGTTFPITFTLPQLFDTAPAVKIIITDISGCTFSKNINCEDI